MGAKTELVLTAALAQELPLGWLRHHGIRVDGVIHLENDRPPAAATVSEVAVVITGTGLVSSRRAALAIRDRIVVLFEGQMMGHIAAIEAKVEEIGLMMLGVKRDGIRDETSPASPSRSDHDQTGSETDNARQNG